MLENTQADGLLPTTTEENRRGEGGGGKKGFLRVELTVNTECNIF